MRSLLYVAGSALLLTLSACGGAPSDATSATGDDGGDAGTPHDFPVSDAGPLQDAPPDAVMALPEAGDGSTGPVGEWVWKDVPGSMCGYGQQTGYAVNVGTGSGLLIYLEGGGLCWDEATCELGGSFGPVTIPHLASYFTSGYDGQTFKDTYGGGGKGPNAGIFDRTMTNNPFKDASMIYVPYCTGDLHTGSTTVTFPVARKTAHFAGRQNLELFLAEIVPAFANAAGVTLTGTSAGGYGALLDYDRVKHAFGAKQVNLVSDSAPIFWNNGPWLPQGFAVWNTKAALPQGCTACLNDNVAHIYDYLATTYPSSRFAFLSHDQDAAISTGMYVEPFFPNFYFEVGDFAKTTLGPTTNWKYFILQGLDHGNLWGNQAPTHSYASNLQQVSVEEDMQCQWVLGVCLPYWVPRSTVLADWLTQMASGDPAWASTSDVAGP